MCPNPSWCQELGWVSRVRVWFVPPHAQVCGTAAATAASSDSLMFCVLRFALVSFCRGDASQVATCCNSRPEAKDRMRQKRENKKEAPNSRSKVSEFTLYAVGVASGRRAGHCQPALPPSLISAVIPSRAAGPGELLEERRQRIVDRGCNPTCRVSRRRRSLDCPSKHPRALLIAVASHIR
jgi:hypothetical protein